MSWYHREDTKRIVYEDFKEVLAARQRSPQERKQIQKRLENQVKVIPAIPPRAD